MPRAMLESVEDAKEAEDVIPTLNPLTFLLRRKMYTDDLGREWERTRPYIWFYGMNQFSVF